MPDDELDYPAEEGRLVGGKWLDLLHAYAEDAGCSVGLRIVSFHPDDQGFCRDSLVASLEVRLAERKPRFRERRLVAAERLVGARGYIRTVEEASKTLVAQLQKRYYHPGT